MTTADLEHVVAVHMEAFPSFFLTALGPKFLKEYYWGVLADQTGIAFVAEDDFGRIAGFVAGSAEARGFYRRLRNGYWWRFAWAALPAVLRDPGIARRVLRGLTHPGSQPVARGSAGLFSLAVSPKAHRGGIGGSLVSAFVADAAHRGATEIRLTTDATGNDAVNRFYLRQGFAVARTFSTPEGREMHEYTLTPKDCPQTSETQ